MKDGTAWRTTPEHGLLERTSELEQLGDVLPAAAAGEGRLVVVEGEPGIGKSALLDAAAKAATAGGMAVLRAGGGELEREFEFGCVLQLLERRIADAGEDERRTLLSGAAGLAAPLLAPSGAATLPGSGDLYPILHGLLWLCATLADEQPLALIVDDAHWADAASLRFLAYLAQRVEELPVVVIAATRPPEPGTNGDLVRRLLAHPRALLLHPTPLSPAGTRAMIARRLGEPDDRFVDACHAAAGGNPLLVHELLLALVEEGRPPTAASVARAQAIAPAPISRAIGLALARLDDRATRLVRAAAVLGEAATVPRLQRLSGLETGELLEQAAALRGASILAAGPEVRFAHPVLRSAIYQDIEAGERADAHARVAELLTDDGAPPEQIAVHLLEAPLAQVPGAARMLRDAAERALAGGVPDTALRLLRRAAQEPRGDDGDLDVALARAAVASGVPEAPALLQQAADRLAAAADSPHAIATQVEILREAGRLAYAQARFDDASRAFDEALGCAPAGDEDLRASIAAERAAAALWHPEQGAAAIHDLGTLLGPGVRPPTQAQRSVMGNFAGALMLKGDDRVAAVELARRAWGDGAFLTEGSAGDPAVSAITGVLTVAEELDDSLAVGDALVADARARGSVLAFATASYLRGAAWLHAGSPREAAADGQAAIDARHFGWSVYLPPARWVVAAASLELGDLEAARAAIALTPDEAQEEEANAAAIGLLLARGQVRLAEGRPDDALAALERAREMRAVIGTDNPAFLGWRRFAIPALTRLGRASEATTLAHEQLALAERWGASGMVGVALLGMAHVTGGERQLDHLASAVDALRGSPMRLELARALIALGAALRTSRSGHDAREPLREALDLAERQGAAGVAEHARSELVATGARPRRPRLTGPEALTPQELRVARLAAQGLTNRQIAEALFITLKVVKWHLGNAYTKLGIGSRGELGGALFDRDAPR